MSNATLFPAIFFLWISLLGSAHALDPLQGVPTPPAHQNQDGSLCYAYSDFLVFVTPTPTVGENILVCKRSKNIPSDQLFHRAKLPKYLNIPADKDANYFAGIYLNALFIIAQTSPDTVLKIYNLETKKKIIECGFHGTIQVVNEETIEFEKLIKPGIMKLSPSEAKRFPKINQWLQIGNSAGWFQKVSVNLETFKESSSENLLLREMQ